MFEIEHKNGEVAKTVPEELQRKLTDVISTVAKFAERAGHGLSMDLLLEEDESMDYLVNYFDDEKYRDASITYHGLPMRAESMRDGVIKIVVGVEPYKDGKPTGMPSEDGLPYEVSYITLDQAKSLTN